MSDTNQNTDNEPTSNENQNVRGVVEELTKNITGPLVNAILPPTSDNDISGNDITGNDITGNDISGNNTMSGGETSTQLAKSQVKKITEELCNRLKESSSTIGENIETMVLQNVKWDKFGDKLVALLTDKINSRLENVKYVITSSNNITGDVTTVSNEPEIMNPISDNAESEIMNPISDNAESEIMNPISDKVKPDTDNELNTTINREDQTGQTGGKKRKTKKIRYINNNKTRRNL